MLRTPDYEDEPLTPGEDLLLLPGFWAAYLLWLAEGEELEPEPALFGVDGADVDAAVEVLHDPAAWPVIRLPLADGHRLVIVHRNFTDDEGVDYHLDHPEWDRALRVASAEGHYTGPGLSWPELLHAARHPGEGPGVTDPHARLLLLLPALGDAELPPDAATTVAEALTGVGVRSAQLPELAEALLDHPFWDGPSWVTGEDAVSPLSGATTTPSRLPRCSEQHSPRHTRLPLTPAQDARLAEALGGGA
ncbi:hypothetical protein GCM10020229_02420 [Kitasatospora albolonga]|uniref:hypothetical protein n=1 Tax=Kitasatospora albolonga TaxID=68173 RepID=UPI0031E89E5D